jgi:2-polyprenyl-3-methyl-5-hydroxy-6-metoxy-1,4-benzoquinol methylase
MIQTPPEFRALLSELTAGALSLATLAVLVEAGVLEQLREPRTLDELAAACPAIGKTRLERGLALAAAHGVVGAEDGRYRLAPGVCPFALPQMRAAFVGDLRAPLLQAVALYDAAARKDSSTGWQHTDPAILQTQGDSSIGIAMMLKMMVIPQLGDLGERLARPGARFLDVGVGVASLAIAMCRAWPELGVVGVDPYEAPLALARPNVERAGLSGRIELRHQAVEKLPDQGAFDLAWLPAFFVPTAVISDAIARVHASLKPGGWMVFATFGGGSGKVAAVSGVLAEMWGGPLLTPAEVEAQLARAGFTNTKLLPGPPGGTFAVAQRA